MNSYFCVGFSDVSEEFTNLDINADSVHYHARSHGRINYDMYVHLAFIGLRSVTGITHIIMHNPTDPRVKK